MEPFAVCAVRENDLIHPAPYPPPLTLPAMNSFDLTLFARQLIAETLFYDEEFGALGNLSLVDPDAKRERFIASYMPDDGVFVIEEATDWEDPPADEDDEIGYSLAVDSNEHGTYETPEEAADAVLQLAQEHGLFPSVTLLFEEDELI